MSSKSTKCMFIIKYDMHMHECSGAYLPSLTTQNVEIL